MSMENFNNRLKCYYYFMCQISSSLYALERKINYKRNIISRKVSASVRHVFNFMLFQNCV